MDLPGHLDLFTLCRVGTGLVARKILEQLFLPECSWAETGSKGP